MDALSDVLRIVSLKGGVFLDAEFSAPWCIKSQIGPEDCHPFIPEATQILAYHYVVHGEPMVRVADVAPVALKEGDIILFPRNDAHYLGSVIERNPVNAHDLIKPPRAGGGLPHIVHGGGGPQTRLVCGFLGSDVEVSPLLASLPPGSKKKSVEVTLDGVRLKNFTVTDRSLHGTLSGLSEGRHTLRIEVKARVGRKKKKVVSESWFEIADLERPSLCEVLNGAQCALPFPSSHWLAPAATPMTELKIVSVRPNRTEMRKP